MDSKSSIEQPLPSLLSEPSLKNNNQTTMRTSCPLQQQHNEQNQQEQLRKQMEIQINNQRKISNTHQQYLKVIQTNDGIKSLQEDGLLKSKKIFARDNALFKTFGMNSNQSQDQYESKNYKQHINKFKNQDFIKKQPIYQNFEQKIQKLKKKHQLIFLNVQQAQIKDKQVHNKNINTQTQCYFQISPKKIQKTLIKIMKNKINLGPISIDINKVMKIKIYPAQTCQQKNICKEQTNQPANDCYFPTFKSFAEFQKIIKQNIIKITTAENTFHFSQRYPKIILPLSKQAYTQSTIPSPQGPASILGSRLPLPYLSYAKIILKKLKQLYPTIKSTQWQPPQFPLRTLIKQNNLILPPAFNKYNKKNFAYIHGKIYKRSKHKAKWQKRYIIINECGIYSYKNEKDQIYSFNIQCKQIKYMWTWFTILKVDKQQDKITNQIEYQQQYNITKKITDQLKKSKKPIQSQPQCKPQINENIINQNHNAYLIIKLKHGFNEQTQFGIPICGFDNQINKNKNWLFAFYKILSQYQY